VKDYPPGLFAPPIPNPQSLKFVDSHSPSYQEEGCHAKKPYGLPLE